MSFRIQRVEKIIERSIAEILRTEAHDECLKYVSITKCASNQDLSVVQVWYTVLGDEAQIQRTSKKLEEAKGFVRSSLAHYLDIRKIPDLKFKYDNSLEYGNHISEIIEKFKK